MTDQAIVVLNAGSSSLKFSVFFEQRAASSSCGSAARSRGSVSAPRFVAQGRCRRDGSARSRGPTGRKLGHDGALDAPVRVPARATARRRATGRRRAPGRPWRPGLHAARCASTRRCSPRSRSSCRWRRCTSRTTSRRSARCCSARPELPQVACFDTAFHRTKPESRRCSRCRDEMHEAGRAALRLPRPVLRVHRLGAAAVRRDAPRRAGPSCCTSATAPACAR